jgi:hypothetical protein
MSRWAWHSIQRETDTEIAPLTQKVGAASIAEIDRLMAELQLARQFLRSFDRQSQLVASSLAPGVGTVTIGNYADEKPFDVPRNSPPS